MSRNTLSIDSNNPESVSPSDRIAKEKKCAFSWQAETLPFSKMTFVHKFTT
jgi:hypothetical protein